ncbi:hypothetical protein VQ042_25255 [Aurantimonas sp. A2-1-M11]|uniref:hypothetical protein n=1 Tax=Aurantimonas sp. A2-1-M11 TaxID=3113712 RepID=UPI002F93F898
MTGLRLFAADEAYGILIAATRAGDRQPPPDVAVIPAELLRYGFEIDLEASRAASAESLHGETMIEEIPKRLNKH